jgi:hypothetical protein
MHTAQYCSLPTLSSTPSVPGGRWAWCANFG